MADIVIASTANASMSDYPLWLQATGGDPGIAYPAAEFRQLIDKVAREGVCGLTDFQVKQRAAGANLTVDFSAGSAFIAGDSVARQGKFLVDSTGVVNSGTNLTVPGSGTRTHRAIARVLDKQAAGSAYGWTFEILEDTGSGMPALPASAVDLASIAVPTGSASITNSMIRDRRPWGLTNGVLQEQVVVSPVTDVIFSDIPAGIRNLTITWRVRCTAAAVAQDMYAQINSVGAGSYAWANMGMANTTFVGNGSSADTKWVFGAIGAASSVDPNVWGVGRVNIVGWDDPNSGNLAATWEASFIDTGTNRYAHRGGGRFNPAGPYTSIKFFAQSGSIAAGSRFTAFVEI
jgi:hypothetical protein